MSIIHITFIFFLQKQSSNLYLKNCFYLHYTIHIINTELTHELYFYFLFFMFIE